MPDPQLFGTEVINTATYDDDTHNPVSSNAAALLLISLARRYLPTEGISFSTGPSSSQNMICSLSVTGDTKAEAFVDRVTSNYLRRAGLTEDQKNYIRQKVSPDATLNTVLDRVVLTEMINGSEVTTDWYLPLREVFAFVLKALDDRSPEAWPVPEGSTALEERKARFAELDRVIKALAANPQLCSTGIRHAMAQALDGYFGKRLPLNPTDLILQSLRKFVTTTLQNQLAIRFPVDKDPTGEERALFYSQFNNYFSPWLRHQQMPSRLWNAIKQAGGSQGSEQFILNEFSALGVIPDKKVLQLITNYCLKSSLKTMPCDFIPLLASVQGWIARHAGFLRIKLSDRELTAKQTRVKLVLDWLATGLNIERFYFLDRLFDCYDNYQRIANLFIASDFNSGIQTLSYSEASAWMSALFSEPDHFPALLDAEDISPCIVHLGILEKACAQWRQQHYSDFIKNFFGAWFAHEDRDQKALLFSKLAELFLREQVNAEPEHAIKPVIFVDDTVLGEWLSHLNADQSVDVHPYEINRILLHAICYLPETWTPAFFDTLTLILRFIRNNFNSTELSANDKGLKRSSYPKSLLNQINQLTDRYMHYHRGEVIVVYNKHQPVLSPSQLKGVESARAVEYLALTPDLNPWVINTLLDPRFGFQVNAPNTRRYTPIFYAIYHNHPMLFNLLLKQGANLGRELYNGNSLLHTAVSYAENLLKPLLEAIDRVNTPEQKLRCFQQMNELTEQKNNPLQQALKQGSLKTCKELIRHIRQFSTKDRSVILKARNSSRENALLIAAGSDATKFKLITNMLFRLRDRAAIREILLLRDFNSHNVLFLILKEKPTIFQSFLAKLSGFNDPGLVSALLKQRNYYNGGERRNILIHALMTEKIEQLDMLLTLMNETLDLKDQLELMLQLNESGNTIFIVSTHYYADSRWDFLMNWLLNKAHPQLLRAVMKHRNKTGCNLLMHTVQHYGSERLTSMISLYKRLDNPWDQAEILRTASQGGNNALMLSLAKYPDHRPCIIQLIHELPNLADKQAILNQTSSLGMTAWELALNSGSMPLIKELLNLINTLPPWFILNNVSSYAYRRATAQLEQSGNHDLVPELQLVQSRLKRPLAPLPYTSIQPYLKKAASLLTHDYLVDHYLRPFYIRSKRPHHKAIKLLVRQLNKNEIRFGELLIQLDQLNSNNPDNALASIIAVLYGYAFEIMKCFSLYYTDKTHLMESVYYLTPLFRNQLEIVAHLPGSENQAWITRQKDHRGKSLLIHGLHGPKENLELFIDWIIRMENPLDRLVLFKEEDAYIFFYAASYLPLTIPLLLRAIKGMDTQDQLEILRNTHPFGNILFCICISHPQHLETILDALDILDNPEVKAGLLRNTTRMDNNLLMACPSNYTHIILKHVRMLPFADQKVIFQQTDVFSNNAHDNAKVHADSNAAALIQEAMNDLNKATAARPKGFFHRRTRQKAEVEVIPGMSQPESETIRAATVRSGTVSGIMGRSQKPCIFI